MHSIERYGIVALLFLVVTVVAVLMWDGGKDKKNASVLAARPASTAPLEEPAAPHPGRRLALAADARPGPLRRRERAENATIEAPATEDPELRSLGAGAPAVPPAPPAREPEPQTPREQPAPESHVAQAPVSPTARSYTVLAGDTLSQIAEVQLGSSRRWPEIVALNPGLDPSRLRSGKTIQLPAGEPAMTPSAKASPPEPTRTASTKPPAAPTGGASAGTWKVGKGESLWRIAEKALGDGKRWKELVSANPGLNPDHLVLGQVLKLPASALRDARSAPPAAAPAKGKEPVVASASTSRSSNRGGKVK